MNARSPLIVCAACELRWQAVTIAAQLEALGEHVEAGRYRRIAKAIGDAEAQGTKDRARPDAF